jgi:hypothetical protein
MIRYKRNKGKSIKSRTLQKNFLNQYLLHQIIFMDEIFWQCSKYFDTKVPSSRNCFPLGSEILKAWTTYGIPNFIYR